MQDRCSLRVCLLASPALFGGLERVVAGLAIGLRAASHHVAVGLGLAPGVENPLESALRAGGVAVSRLEVPSRAYARERRLVRGLLERQRPMIVHTHGYRSDVVAAPVARGLGIPTVTTLHGFTGGGWRNRFYEWLQIRSLRRFDRVVVVSRPMARRLEAAGIDQDRIRFIPNAWTGGAFLPRREARALLGLPAEASVVGWVGRFSREKGADVLIEALVAMGPAAPLACLVGDGSDAESLRALAERAGVGGRIRWPGVVPDAARCLPAFDVLVLSSRTEGTPVILLEAMAAGVPVVTAAVGGIPDVVSPAEALLVPPEDPPRLASALAEAVSDPTAARARAAAARIRLERDHALAPWIERYVTLYRELLPDRVGVIPAPPSS